MKVKFEYEWGNDYDWIIIPTIMLGFRHKELSTRYWAYVTGFGFAILFLKLKIEFKFFKAEDL